MDRNVYILVEMKFLLIVQNGMAFHVISQLTCTFINVPATDCNPSITCGMSYKEYLHREINPKVK